MTGREENKIITDNKMREKVKREPEAIRNFFEYLCNSGRDSAQTRKVFVNTTIRFSDWVMEQLDIDLYSKKNWKKITPEIINRYLLEAGKNIKPKTKADYHVALNKFFDFLFIMGYINKNPFDGNKVPKQKYSYTENVVYLTEEEIEQTKINIRENEKNGLLYEVIFTLLYKTGIRITALTEINIDDINISDRSIRVTDKENYTRDVFIGDSMIELLKRYFREYRDKVPSYTNAAFVYYSTQKHKYVRVSTRRIDEVIVRNTEFTGKHIPPHKLRDTCAMLVYEKTHDIYLTGEVLGHKNFENTRKYARVTEQRRRETANFLDNI